ncbi:glycine-rich domain-containing protein [Stenoxybacter acetivorans]|uniref:glycine-rich domain-containing protein n=1 Tax=Stenoxybacter acetivorans TaxID=422441 RepID=UPI00068A0B19|nr:hypothetical protein [Stenoxybacter acetivorans]
MDTEEGKAWSLDFAKKVEVEYKKFLTLCLEYPDFSMVPSKTVDDFWHYHILDTQKYQEDCEKIFGYFLHHFPYFGMRGQEDADNLQQAWSESLALYTKRFGDMDNELWFASARCPNCGRRGNNQQPYFHEERPSLPKLAA